MDYKTLFFCFVGTGGKSYNLIRAQRRNISRIKGLFKRLIQVIFIKLCFGFQSESVGPAVICSAVAGVNLINCFIPKALHTSYWVK